MRFGIIPFLLLIVPITEIASFILVGQWIGVLPTLLGIVVTAILGSFLLRRQGMATLTAIRREIDAGRVPGRELVHGLMIALAGVLLMTPGYVTDTLGLLLFIPSLRDSAWRFLSQHVVMVTSASVFNRDHGGRGPSPAGTRRSDPRVVDLDADDYSVHRQDP
ncbi:FxsA family protein [Notoacmeibacter sp. MSK16QG-6]|uniref:FxsA family protein n=1 Tax=Notoacmeibacter sp. MSK16QG-6 TaxID=2957982 RepID=UPI00209C95BA|nr:FxsA family protein [Notoacmeibacter sp. MSK16QG-6]MCP1199100.1 membrane protein FxsA [Notoacmeibacter sp. MSK16QG-6]